MIYVFAGPTISHEQIKRQLECVCLPPVAHGDILRVLKARPSAIAIIDGYFEGAPAVWHKEILYALDQGVHVFGSSSMGALRAAELHSFGMIGVGVIFEWYKACVIEADDEVAVLHGPAEVGYLAASEPMVNIRATLIAAEQQGRISCEQQQKLIDSAKAIHYKNRSFTVFLSLCSELLQNVGQSDDLKAWFLLNRIDLKKQDALALLDVLAEFVKTDSPPYLPDFYFEKTNLWRDAYARHKRLMNNAGLKSASQLTVLNQLRLEPDRYERYSDRALISWLCENPVVVFDEDIVLKQALRWFRANNDIVSHSHLMDCLAHMELDESQLTELLQRACRTERVRTAAGNLELRIIQLLKLDGAYLSLLETNRRKQEVIATACSKPESTSILPVQVFAWYFRTRLGIAFPLNIDAHLKRIGLKDSEEFYRLITAEYLYCKEDDSLNTAV